MVWCAGYLPHKELVAFLRKAKSKLMLEDLRQTRQVKPESFIIILDNVKEDGELMEPIKGQRVRSEHELEALYSEAGLLVHSRTEREPMPGNHRDIVAWALY